MELLDEMHQAFIQRSPFLLLATGAGSLGADISPRGDRAGFVEVVADNTILVPDRVGNNRIDSLSNIIENPYVSIVFFVSGRAEAVSYTHLTLPTTPYV